MFEVLFAILNKSKNASIEKRIARAVLVNGVQSKGPLKELCNKYKSVNISSGSNRMKGIQDYKLLMEGESLNKSITSRKN